jgi:hypothetical protein
MRNFVHSANVGAATATAGRIAAGAALLLAVAGTVGVTADDPWTSVRAAAQDDPWTSVPVGKADDPWT